MGDTQVPNLALLFDYCFDERFNCFVNAQRNDGVGYSTDSNPEFRNLNKFNR